MSRLTTMPPRLARARQSIAKPIPKVKDSIYSTPEFREWRRIVVSRAGNRCEQCGSDSGRMYADHIVELKDGGAPFDPSNGQCLCATHHGLKTAQEKRARQAEQKRMS